MLKLIILTQADADLARATQWIDSERPGSGVEFMAEIHGVFERIEEAPERNPPVQSAPEFRRVVCPRFPYSVIYRSTATEIVVVAVAHHARRPRFWRSRS